MGRRWAAALVAVAVVAGCTSNDGPKDAAPTSTTVAAVDLPTSFPAPTGPACTTAGNGSVLVTPDCVDPELDGAPYIDVDEPRTTKDPKPGVTVGYRYVHGGFKGSDVRFSLYFPPREAYRGRFFESTYPTVSEEDADAPTVAFAISNGAYVVSSNNAGGVAASPVLGGYRANAAAAKFSRLVAAKLYGADAPTRGYIYGASGGAYQTIGAAENTDRVWDGAVPMVPGVPNSIPSFMSVQVLALRVLHDRWPAIVDALEPGGSGDPYATLDASERAILQEATLLGHPLRGWWQWETLRGGAFSVVVPAVLGIDGSYVEDFFTKPGYEGQDPAVKAARVQFDTTVTAVDGGSVTLAAAPTGWLDFSDLVLTSGAAAGKSVPLVTVSGTHVTIPKDAPKEVTSAIAAGDHVRVDNSFYLALSYYQRHQVPTADQYGWDQYRGPDGTPKEPQRPALVGEVLSKVFGGLATGRFNGRMIMLSSTMDVQAFPWGADWYRTHARAVLGDGLDDRYRLWYMDNADHQPPSTTAGYAHIVLYDSELQQALLDLDAWVADGTAPPASSSYRVTDDHQVELAATASARMGVQPVPTLAVGAGKACDGSAAVRAEVGAGEPVALHLTAEVPPGAGKVVRVEWDLDSAGTFPSHADVKAPSASVDRCVTHTYATPGTYFAVARVTSQREGDPKSRYGRIQNLARVRVVVR